MPCKAGLFFPQPTGLTHWGAPTLLGGAQGGPPPFCHGQASATRTWVSALLLILNVCRALGEAPTCASLSGLCFDPGSQRDLGNTQVEWTGALGRGVHKACIHVLHHIECQTHLAARHVLGCVCEPWQVSHPKAAAPQQGAMEAAAGATGIFLMLCASSLSPEPWLCVCLQKKTRIQRFRHEEKLLLLYQQQTGTCTGPCALNCPGNPRAEVASSPIRTAVRALLSLCLVGNGLFILETPQE